MKHFTPYFEADGSYNERHHEKRKPQPARFTLDFNRSISDQLMGRVMFDDGVLLDSMVSAMKFLSEHGALPDRHRNRVEKQIELKAERCISKLRKMTV
jgi:hypothetical protein